MNETSAHTVESIRCGHGFGTGPVFLARIGTILGAVMFLRFGYAVAHTGMLGALLIVLVGHAVVPLVSGLADPDAFMLVFAVVFPAFTGMTAGVGLSRDLANQRRSIPLGLFCAPA